MCNKAHRWIYLKGTKKDIATYTLLFFIKGLDSEIQHLKIINFP